MKTITTMEDQSLGEPAKHPTLSKYGKNVTRIAAKGKLYPVIGRDEQIELIVQILCKRGKNNACLIGHPGVGKTAVACGLAQSIVNATVPHKLQGKKIFYIDRDSLIAETKLTVEFEERLRLVVDEVKQSRGEIILFIDQLHTLIGTDTSAKSTAKILKPPLARGELKCIGATTRNDYKKYMETDPALKCLFQEVEVPEPSVDKTLEILRGLRGKYEGHHNVGYTDEALVACANLSKQYIRDEYLPAMAIDLMDQAGSLVEFKQGRTGGENTMLEIEFHAPVAFVTSEHVKQVISSRTGIPIEKVSQQESSRFLNMVNILQKNIIGQDEAIQAVSGAIRRARVGLRDPCRPIASFLFTGPSGVGKTQIAKLLAQEYIGSKDAMVRLDMSEYMESHSVSRLFGAPPGYIGYDNGGQLTEAIRCKPHNVILLDEIEKAHVNVFNALLQILDDGRLTDSRGHEVDFKETIIIMTSNIGFDSSSYDHDHDHEVKEKDVYKHLKGIFRPEFLNRLDKIIVFNKLGKGDLMKVLDIMLDEVHRRMKLKNIGLEITQKCKERIFLESSVGDISNNYGARPLSRAITSLLVDKLAESILNGDVKEGDSLIADVNVEGEVRFSVKEQREERRENGETLQAF